MSVIRLARLASRRLAHDRSLVGYTRRACPLRRPCRSGRNGRSNGRLARYADRARRSRYPDRHVLTRFAPAPTGYLHLGHVVNALHVWGAARERDGRVMLRIEDHDRQRSKPEYETAILEDLAWLGFKHDGDIVRQSERDAHLPQGHSAADRSRARLRMHVHSRRHPGSGIRNQDQSSVTRTPAATRTFRSATVSAGACAWIRASSASSTRPRAAGTGSERAMRRSAGPRSPRQLDLSVRGDRRRSPAAHHRRDSRRGSAVVHRPADSARATARPRRRRRASGITR